ncbi:uncharacterized protein LOC126996353 [Eriocheir sinensis]|uniref:uncharacterized protein LOC126996353 n=1 Tax=Eriocheir sinensis TaxID=95602 RepID=UPI0021CA497D|nr:uncharacterized protein LOC126996353 [Eriocheir sinensis]
MVSDTYRHVCHFNCDVGGVERCLSHIHAASLSVWPKCDLLGQVRRLSRCTVVVVVSHDPAFLAAFAEWSLRGRLLVWSTSLVVVTRLALPMLRALLPAHWTFAMMNTIVLSVNTSSRYSWAVFFSFTVRFEEYSSFITASFQVFSYLPYSPAGPMVVQVASWTHSCGLVLTEGHTLFEEKFSK